MAFLRVKTMGLNLPYQSVGDIPYTLQGNPQDGFVPNMGTGMSDPQSLIASLYGLGIPQMPIIPGVGGQPFTQVDTSGIGKDWTSTPSGNWFDSLKGWGGKAVSSFMPKINAETGKMETLGWGMPALQGLSSLGNMYLGMKNYGLAKDQLRTQKDQFAMNYANQVKTLNTDMEDRARSRAIASRNAESPESYMARNRIK